MTRPDAGFWRRRKVLLTGHTGFKGSLMTLMLNQLGARVTGLALPPPPGPSLFALLAPSTAFEHRVVDLRNAPDVLTAVRAASPSVVLHLGAQALVPAGYRDPVGTFAVNLSGSVNLLQALREVRSMDAAVFVTTDKVYRNPGDGRAFREDDPLGGDDPYSASKAAAEIAVSSWRTSFGEALCPIATARAGNVVGGGDFAPSRLVPDIVRSVTRDVPLTVRYPTASRPWQYVLDVLTGYLLLAEHLVCCPRERLTAVNFAPRAGDAVTVTTLIEAFGRAFGRRLSWHQAGPVPPEAKHLPLDAGLAAERLGWRPRLDHAAMVRETASWYAAWWNGEDMAARYARDISEALG